MKPKLLRLVRRYQAALQTYLKQKRHAGLDAARGLGQQALAAGLPTLDLAKAHEQTLLSRNLPRSPPGERAALIQRAGDFFAVAMTPVEPSRRGKEKEKEKERFAYLNTLIKTLSQRTVELAASNLELNLEITHRKAAEDALRISERQYVQLLEQSDRLQEQLRLLSRDILSAQEDERKRISRELHDVIAQTLTGINLRLGSLKQAATANATGLSRNITSTQRLVVKSVGIVQRFARELRPALLDELGLIPALHAFLKAFSARTGIRTALTAGTAVEQLDIDRRTILFRVAQEAFTNIARHAQARQASVAILQDPTGFRMTVSDDGKAFDVQLMLRSHGSRHLGILGMRERLAMIGGQFEITSRPGVGTTILARIPSGKGVRPVTTRTPKALKAKFP